MGKYVYIKFWEVERRGREWKVEEGGLEEEGEEYFGKF